MQFLKTVLWVVAAVLLVLFGSANWEAVTVRLWGGLQVDIKLPVLVLLAFLLGFLPTLIVHRAKLWSLKRRLEPGARTVSVAPPASPAAPATVDNGTEERVATDTKVWPAT